MRDRMIQRIKRSRGCDHATAVRIEQGWFEDAWARSLLTDDADHNPCDHDERTFERVYQQHVADEFGAARSETI